MWLRFFFHCSEAHTRKVALVEEFPCAIRQRVNSIFNMECRLMLLVCMCVVGTTCQEGGQDLSANEGNTPQRYNVAKRLLIFS